MRNAFMEVTRQTFQAGQKVEALKPVAPVKPIQRKSKPEVGPSDNERVNLPQFLAWNLAIIVFLGLSVDAPPFLWEFSRNSISSSIYRDG